MTTEKATTAITSLVHERRHTYHRQHRYLYFCGMTTTQLLYFLTVTTISIIFLHNITSGVVHCFTLLDINKNINSNNIIHVPAQFVRHYTYKVTDIYTNRNGIGNVVVTSSSFSSQRKLSLGGGDDNNIIIIIASGDDDEGNIGGKMEIVDEDDDNDNSTAIVDPYVQVASSEFSNNNSMNTSDVSTDLVLSNDQMLTTSVDWGGALGKLRQRFDDIEQGKSGNPSQALFRLMSAQSPNQAIGTFIQSANPQIVQAMSSAVTSLLGGLSSPTTGIETIVKATGTKIGTLCFQLQMTGYMFRNVEYVVALKKLMKIRGSASLQDYKDAFERLDTDKSGYIESSEVSKLLEDVYDGKVPDFEIEAFIKFFDKNNDGKISWDEFEKGLGVAMASQRQKSSSNLPTNLLPQVDDDDDEDDEISLPDPEISGTVQIEFKNGKVVDVDAKEYIESLKAEAIALKEALAKQNGRSSPRIGKSTDSMIHSNNPNAAMDDYGGITSYITSQQGDVKALTQGISPEIVETMKMLINFVLEGGDSGKGKDVPKDKMEMEIPGSALQQLALWQLVLGYKLREAEAKGEYLKLLE